MNLSQLNERVLDTYQSCVESHDISSEHILSSLSSLTAVIMSDLNALSVTIDDNLKIKLIRNDVDESIPLFLLEMSKQMHEQDNRITAEPIWVVCYDEWLTCSSGRGDKVIILLNDNGEYIECDDSDHFPIFEHLTEYHSEWCQENFDTVDADELSDLLNLYYEELPDGVSVEQLDMQKVVHKLKYCLTEADANWFIRRKQHDYPKLYTYVESMVYCPQMIELRNWILSLTNAEVSNG